MQYSILYVDGGRNHRIGPFDSDDEAMSAAISAQEEGEFDIRDQRVYLLWGHDLREISTDELTANDQKDIAMSRLRKALRDATACGLMDDLAGSCHPDIINEFCDAVGYDE